MDEKEIQSFLIVSSVVLFFLAATMVSLFLLFRKRRRALLLEKEYTEKQFEQEISKAQIEIREEAFRNISWELHDNIGQLLTLAKIQLQNNSPIEDVKETLNKSLKELRGLSKLINPDALQKMTLKEAINDEVNRFNRLNYISAVLEVKGNIKKLDGKIEIVFYRMLQEFFSNTLKHARATKLDVILEYTNDAFIIIAKDNGLGFNVEIENNSGIGLNNIKSRAELVNATATITSILNRGTKLTIIYPLQNENF